MAAAGGAGSAPSSALTLKELFAEVPRTTTVSEEQAYVYTNEIHQKPTILWARTAPIKGNTIVGVSGLFTLNLVAARALSSLKASTETAGGAGIKVSDSEIENLIMVDVSQRTQFLWKEMEKIIRTSSTKESAQESIRKLITEHVKELGNGEDAKLHKMSPEMYFTEYREACLAWMDCEIRSGISWLSTDDSYRAVKRIFDSNRFCFLRVDFTEPVSFVEMSSIMRKNGMTVDTIYTSNVPEYISLKKQSLHTHLFSVRTISHPETSIVTCGPRITGMLLQICMNVTNYYKDIKTHEHPSIFDTTDARSTLSTASGDSARSCGSSEERSTAAAAASDW